MKRREFLFASSLFTFGWIFGRKVEAKNTFAFGTSAKYIQTSFANNFQDVDFTDQFPYSLPRLPYSYNSLEPFIDERTMNIHHTKHHAAYVNNLNKALENTDFKSAPLLQLFKKISTLDKAIRNNGGGHYNHSLFWMMMKANPNKEKNMPSEELQKIFNQFFGNYENFKSQFSEKALKIFGSGWCWLIVNEKKELKIVTTPNQDNPLMDVTDEKDRGVPLLGLDVWEHAYYLNYQNRRAEYIENWWNVINWEFVEKRWKNTN